MNDTKPHWTTTDEPECPDCQRQLEILARRWERLGLRMSCVMIVDEKYTPSPAYKRTRGFLFTEE